MGAHTTPWRRTTAIAAATAGVMAVGGTAAVAVGSVLNRPAKTMHSAVVDTVGTLLHGHDVARVTHPAVGRYDILFKAQNNYDYSDCTQTVSLASAVPAVVSAHGFSDQRRLVEVNVLSASGTAVNEPFQLIEVC